MMQSSQGRARRALGLAGTLLSWATVLVAVVGLAGVLAITVLPRVLGWQGVVILSGSMAPTLQTGGIAFVEPASPDDVRVFDILTYRVAGSQRSMITHRVIETEGVGTARTFRTKGDANQSADRQIVTADQVVGKVRYGLPYVGRAIDKLRSRDNYYIFVGIPASLLILNEVLSVAKEVRRPRPTRETAASPSEGAAS